MSGDLQLSKAMIAQKGKEKEEEAFFSFLLPFYAVKAHIFIVIGVGEK